MVEYRNKLLMPLALGLGILTAPAETADARYNVVQQSNSAIICCTPELSSHQQNRITYRDDNNQGAAETYSVIVNPEKKQDMFSGFTYSSQGNNMLIDSLENYNANSYAQRKPPARKPRPKPRPVPKKPAIVPRPIYAPGDTQLAANMRGYINYLHETGQLAPTDSVSVSVHDYDTVQKVVSINEGRQVMAASTIKNFYLLLYFRQLDNGNIEGGFTGRDARNLRLMVTNTRHRLYNVAANYILARIGGPDKANELLHNDFPMFESTDILEFIPAGGATYRNKTSAHDLDTFYYQLWLGNLPHSEEIEHYLGLEKHDRLKDSTCIPGSAALEVSKTGSVFGQISDSGRFSLQSGGGTGRYSIVVVFEDSTRPAAKFRSTGQRRRASASWMRSRTRFVRDISEGVFDYFEQLGGNDYICEQHKGRHLAGLQ